MKKFLFLILITLVSVVANAQIFTHKEILDKFDDVVSKRDIKTIIEKNDTAFIIEEKGNKPTVYLIKNYAEYNSMGSKDNIVNLVGNVYGYQECWFVILEKDMLEYLIAYMTVCVEEDENKRASMIAKMLDDYGYWITHRVVTTQYTHELLFEYYWVQKGENNGRTIYSIYY